MFHDVWTVRDELGSLQGPKVCRGKNWIMLRAVLGICGPESKQVAMDAWRADYEISLTGGCRRESGC